MINQTTIERFVTKRQAYLRYELNKIEYMKAATEFAETLIEDNDVHTALWSYAIEADGLNLPCTISGIPTA